MIHSVRGTLIHIEPRLAVVECGGVGMACQITMNTARQLPAQGDEVMLYTVLNVREDAMELFGFADTAERRCFLQLTSVSGVGPKAAIAILSELSPDKLALAIATGDHKTITRAQGVGPKLAQRVVLELKDKIKGFEVAQGITQTDIAIPADTSNIGVAISALVELGYSQSEAAQALSKLDGSLSVEALITGALRKMAGM